MVAARTLLEKQSDLDVVNLVMTVKAHKNTAGDWAAQLKHFEDAQVGESQQRGTEANFSESSVPKRVSCVLIICDPCGGFYKNSFGPLASPAVLTWCSNVFKVVYDHLGYPMISGVPSRRSCWASPS